MWDYIVPYRSNLAEVLAALHRTVFESHDYAFTLDEDDRRPATLEELWRSEEIRYGGTHSVLDIRDLIPPDSEDGFGTLRPLTEAERLRFFGTAMPSRADFQRAYDFEGEGALADEGQRWSGYCTTLYDEKGEPAQVAIWGYSGD